MGLDGALLPADERSRFATSLSDSLCHSYIKEYLSAVRSLHIDHGQPDPTVNCLQLQRLLRGIKRAHGSSPTKRLAPTTAILRVIQGSFDQGFWDHFMLWATSCLCFVWFSPGRRVHNLSATLLQYPFDSEQRVGQYSDESHLFFIRKKSSKTDPFQIECDIYVHRGDDSICPVAAIGNFLALRGAAPGPLSCYVDGRPLSQQQLFSRVQSILHSAGYPGLYSGHRFRSSAASTAVTRGVPDHLIKTLGRWSSDTYQVYIRTNWLPIEICSQLT